MKLIVGIIFVACGSFLLSGTNRDLYGMGVVLIFWGCTNMNEYYEKKFFQKKQ